MINGVSDIESESGVTMVEYAIALSILIGGLVVANGLLVGGAKEKSKSIAISNTKMVPCQSTIIKAEIAKQSSLIDQDEACQ
jgi:Flp pilus assembly pilin Flp